MAECRHGAYDFTCTACLDARALVAEAEVKRLRGLVREAAADLRGAGHPDWAERYMTALAAKGRPGGDAVNPPGQQSS